MNADSSTPSRLVRWYRAAALVLANGVLVLALANGVAWLALRLGGGRPPEPGTPAYERTQQLVLDLPVFQIDRFFPGYTKDDIAMLIGESFGRPPVYEPFTQFRERPYRGRFVNVDPAGFRLGRDPGPWPPDPSAVSVFVFGGSTTFGMGLPDGETIVSHLSDLVRRRSSGPVHFYNFGAGYYFSTQERVQFEQLLLAGRTPNVAIFVDGLNDFFQPDGVPALTARLARQLSGTAPAPAHPWLDAVRATALGQAAARVQQWLARRAPRPAPPAPQLAPAAADDDGRVAGVVARYRGNKRMIEAVARAHGVRPLFVWQPVPTYKYDLAYHRFHPNGFGRVELTRAGYAAMAALVQTAELGSDFVWCADLQEGRREELYLDLVHYAPRMARRVAACIAKPLVRDGLVSYDPAYLRPAR